MWLCMTKGVQEEQVLNIKHEAAYLVVYIYLNLFFKISQVCLKICVRRKNYIQRLSEHRSIE